MAKISFITARQVFDSRGNPTVEADVYLEDGSLGRAMVPSGASTGSKEALELRDGGDAYRGKGVFKAVSNITSEIQNALIGFDVSDQALLDKTLIELDGTLNKERLGANALLAVSLASAKAEANAREQFFFEYVGTLSRLERAPLLPMPMCNVLNGGVHADGSADIQEFMLVPVGASTFTQAMQMTTEVFHTLYDVLKEEGYATTVGDEGGFAPHLKRGNREALELLTRAVERAKYVAGTDFAFAVDIAANSLYTDENYTLKSEGKVYTSYEMIDYYETLVRDFPLISIEDGLMEDDWEGWKALFTRFEEGVQIVGDDLLVTNTVLLKKAIEEKVANAILIKVNQIGTLTETIDAVDTAHEAGWSAIVSHRSGETEDTSIAHLAVGLSTGQIKTGSMSRSDRVAKYNELLRIEEYLGEGAIFDGVDTSQEG